MNKTCQQCKKEIFNCNKNFCCNRCKKIFFETKNTNVCVICGINFIKRKSKNRTIKFCSNKCKFTYQKLNPPRPKSGTYKKCKACGNVFYTQKNQMKYKYCSIKCFNKYRTMLISTGDFSLYGKYNQGYYISKISGVKERYDSSYELRRMIFLDTQKIKWTKKHGIQIPYTNKNGELHYYIPDLLVGTNIIEEIKPQKFLKSNYNNSTIKIKAGEEFCKNRGYTFRVITEKELEYE